MQVKQKWFERLIASYSNNGSTCFSIAKIQAKPSMLFPFVQHLGLRITDSLFKFDGANLNKNADRSFGMTVALCIRNKSGKNRQSLRNNNWIALLI